MSEAEQRPGPQITDEDIAAAVAAKEAAWQSRPPLKRLGELDIMTAVLESTLRPGGLVARAVADELERIDGTVDARDLERLAAEWREGKR